MGDMEILRELYLGVYGIMDIPFNLMGQTVKLWYFPAFGIFIGTAIKIFWDRGEK